MSNEVYPIVRDEVGLKDVADFFGRNRRLIGIGVAAGLVISAAYVFLAPKEYEAKWQVQMAQLNGANIEEPSALMQRLRFPSVYPVSVLQSCGMSKEEEAGEYLNESLGVQPVKNVASTAEFKFRARSIDGARQCAEALQSMIVEQQAALIEERLSGRRELLLQYQNDLREELQQLEKIKKSDLSDVAYLSRLDKLSSLRSRVEALREEMFLSAKHPGKLTAPVFVSSKPTSPKVGLSLLLGLLLGFMLGVLYALGRDGWRKTE